MKKKYKRSIYGVAFKIVSYEIKKTRSLKPLKLLWQKRTYGDKWPFILHNTTLIDYINFCRVNNIPYISIPEEELA